MKLLYNLLLCMSFAASPVVAADDDDTNSKKSKAEVPNPIEHDLEPIIVPVIKNGKVMAYLRLTLKLVTKDKVAFQPFIGFLPRLRDAYFSDIFSAMCDQWLPYKDPVPATVLTRLQKITNSVIKTEEIVVYITNFYFYRLPSDSSK